MFFAKKKHFLFPLIPLVLAFVGTIICPIVMSTDPQYYAHLTALDWNSIVLLILFALPNTSWHHSPHTYHSKISTPTQKPPFTLITQLNHLLHSHQHIITLISHHKNFSPLNLQNTPKHNPSLSNPNLINYRTLSNAASPSYRLKNLSSLNPQNLLIPNSIKNSTTHTTQTN